MNARITLLRFFAANSFIFFFNNVFAVVPTISYSPSTNAYTINTAITTLTPTVTNAPTSYSITAGTLPTGLTFSTVNGKVTGTPTALYPTATITVKATNGSGSSAGFVLTFTVNPTVPIGTGNSVCSSGSATLAASGSTPAGGVYNWYAALSGGSSLGTGATFTTPSLNATTTYYVDYTKSGTTSKPRTAVTATVTTAPVLATPTTTGAYFSYPFTGGSTTDATGGGNNGTLQGGPATTTDRFGVPNNAYTFDGVSQYIATTKSYASPGPQNFSVSVWFNTTTGGGLLVGFGILQTGFSHTKDRNIYMSDNGQIYFGAYTGGDNTLNTTASYNDGKWHNVVVTMSTANGASLYVDGALQATNASMNTVQVFAGYWRVGYDSLTGWPNAPTDFYFTGSLDDIAAYNTELTPAQVYAQYGAGSSSYCVGNPLTLQANTVAGATYAWSGPGGFSSSVQNPTVTANAAAANMGAYTCTVTGANGCTSSINVTVPSDMITYTWTGGTSSDPTAAGNWTYATGNNLINSAAYNLPRFDGTSDLSIPTGLANYPVLTANETAYGLTIGSGATFGLGGFTLNVGCNIINNASTGGTGILYGANNASGVTWNGSVPAQSYIGTNTANTAQLGTMTVSNSASGTVTINGGPVDIYSTLTMTNGNLVVSASPAALNLKSTATLTASVSAIPPTCLITGDVNAERYITGGAGYRGYRLISSPVYAAYVTADTTNVYSINYLQTYTYLTGNAGGGFDKTGNPTLYLYREDIPPSNASFISGNFWGFSKIDNATSYNYYLNGAATTYNIPVGNGVMFFFRGNRAAAAMSVETQPSYTTPVTVTTVTSGPLNQGQVVVRDWYTPTSKYLGWTNASANSVVRGFNLVGNPYASSIDWEQYNTATTTTGIYVNNVGNTIYELNPATNNYDTYQIGGAFTNHGTKTIASGQGFFVLAANNSNPELIFNESAKTAAQNTGLNLFMDTRASVASLNNAGIDQHLRLQLAKDSINTDDIYIGFNSTAKPEYVFNEDAPYKSGAGQVSLASISSDNLPLAINRLPLPKQSQIIPLNVDATSDGVYQLKGTEFAGVPRLYNIWLRDAYKKDSIDLRNNTTYAFDLYKADTNSYGSKRFSLVIRQNPVLAMHLLNFTANKAQNGAQIVWITENEQNYTNFTVERSTDNGITFNVLGGFVSNGSGTYNFLDKNPALPADGYRLKIVDLNGSITYSKVVTLIYSNLDNDIANNNFTVYPNPASNVINLSINQSSHSNSGLLLAPGFSSIPGSPILQTVNSTPSLAATSNSGQASYSIKIISVAGSVIKTAISPQPNWKANIGDLLPGTYVIQVIDNSDNSVVGKSTFIKL